ncbi:MAG: DNA-binding transcriptional regulator OxyR [Gammaproteobacteria bacterium]
MNLRDLRYLVAVAEHRHFGRAAEACFVSQPTLSTQVRKLEEELGVVLIERTSRQVMLTSVGERIVAQAQRVLREVNQMVDIAQTHQDPFGGEFRLGIIPTVAPYLLPRILGPMQRAFPKLRTLLTEGQTHNISRMLRDGELDAVILALPLDEEHLRQVHLYAEPFLLAVSRLHPKASRKSVGLSDLEGEQVLLLEDGHCLRDQALSICATAHAQENTSFRATSIETLRQMVAANAGVTLMPELAVMPKSGPVRYLPFDGPVPHRDIGLCWRTSSTRDELLQALATLLGDHLRGVFSPARDEG